MKNKIVLIAGLVTVLFASCKKDRVCECTTTTIYDKPIFSNSTTTFNYTYKKVTKKQIKTLCTSYKQEFSGGTTTVDCDIK